MNCRTHKLGAHSNVCEDCGSSSIAYNSCRDRHCPLCQSFKREKWRIDRNAELLNVHYFHVVFTIPEELHELFLHNQSMLYTLLMKSSAKTLLELAQNKRYLGADLGLTAVLHTWGQTLSYHPHVHFIVPGGGLCPESGLFKTSRKNFLIPVKVLSNVFRAIFLKALKELALSDELYTNLNAIEFKDLINQLYGKAFVVYAKENFDSPGHVINYLCQYTHRVAISNHRLLSADDNRVVFSYKDYRDQGRKKTMSLSTTEFLRRFAMHILPAGFSKVRYYGFLANCNKKTKLAKCQTLLRIIPSKKSLDYTAVEFIKRFMDKNAFKCSQCKVALNLALVAHSNVALDSS
ncbi:MAG: IS91 family transposase [Clostridia bacterium]|nr:IS91 family transposase [Clostridia bacterium]